MTKILIWIGLVLILVLSLVFGFMLWILIDLIRGKEDEDDF